MTKFEEEFNYLIELSGKVLIGQVDAEAFEKNRISFFEKYETDQQQALPVVPSLVADWYEFHMNGTFSAVVTAYAFAGDDKAVVWLGENGGMDLLCKMKLYGYTVEKPQLFRLKLKNTPISNYYLWLNHATGKVFVDKKFLDWTNHDNVKNIFTEQEIAKISDGAFVNNKAFELVPVEDGE